MLHIAASTAMLQSAARTMPLHRCQVQRRSTHGQHSVRSVRGSRVMAFSGLRDPTGLRNDVTLPVRHSRGKGMTSSTSEGGQRMSWHPADRRGNSPASPCKRAACVTCSSKAGSDYAVTNFQVETPDVSDEVLECPSLRHMLRPRPSPFCVSNNFGGGFVSDEDRVALSSIKFASADSAGAKCISNDNGHSSWLEASMEQLCVPLPPWSLRAGARETIWHNPVEVNAAIVTCGGLCPGLNDVVQGLVSKLTDYGVPEGNIIGIRYGFRGFYDRKTKPIMLTKKSVEGIHLEGGTILGTSRGGADLREIVKQIDLWGIDMVFVVGGNGGNAGAAAIQEELQKNDILCSVVAVPKSIDNDILLIDKTFGFDTAVEEAQRALLAAKVEAGSAYRGIGLVKLMGRQSGFIAMQASMASGVVDICLIPEVPFKLYGETGMFAYLEKVLSEKGHAMVCVAEGAGQDILDEGEVRTDASGNPILQDVGPWMKKEIKKCFKDADVKYIDPSYQIRSIPTISGDRIYCKVLAHNAVHAAFAGFTGVTMGLVNTHYCYLPIHTVIQAPRRVDPRGKTWNRLRASIGQPNFY